MLYDGDTFERGGRIFRVEFPFDDFADAPWEREDGHGPVSDWTTRDKLPGEKLLNSDRSHKLYYDAQEATKIAKRDGWGLCDKDKAKLTEKLGREPKRGDIVAEAVEQDFDRLRRWCDDQWQYVGVVVTLLDDNEEDTGENESLWAIESDAQEALEEAAFELADEILARVTEREARDMESSRPDMYHGA